MKAGASAVLYVSALAWFAILMTGGCRHAPTPPSAYTEARRVPTGSGQDATAEPTAKVALESMPRLPEADDVKPSVPSYSADRDLGNIVNLYQFPNLSDREKALLAANCFFVRPADEEQLFYVYQQNSEASPQVPSFITSDSVLQLYHLFFDYALRKMERDKFMGLVKALSKAMWEQSSKQYRSAKAEQVKEAAMLNVAFFAVACELLRSPVAVAEEAKELVDDALAKIQAHQKLLLPDDYPFVADFSQFLPRGHYTRTEEFKRYFKAMMWYGLVPCRLASQDPPLPPRIWQRDLRRALLMLQAFRTANIGGRRAEEVWRQIYEPTAFMVGYADDLTPQELTDFATRVYGHLPGLTELADESKLGELRDVLAKEAPRPGIAVALILTASQGGEPQGVQFRFMSQRLIPDSRVFQELVAPEVGGRGFPLALDFPAALGSERAWDLLVEAGQPQFSDYTAQMRKMQTELAELPAEKWQSNAYYGWIYALAPLLEPKGAGYPAFMTKEAWVDKQLTTFLASWSELRHDTILYAKQSGYEGIREPREGEAVPKGYVEPELSFYARLKWLVGETKKGLMRHGLFDERSDLAPNFDSFGDVLGFLADVSAKELQEQRLADEEYGRIAALGRGLEQLSLAVVSGEDGIGWPSEWREIENDTDRDMACIADVHTGPNKMVLEEAVGHAFLIHVAVPIEGEIYLTRGPTFSHYEFRHPADDRLTDEQWQKMVKKGQLPKLAPWMKSFVVADSGSFGDE